MHKSTNQTKALATDSRGFVWAWVLLIGAALLVSGCEKRGERVQFEDQFFRAKASKGSNGQRESFVVEVADAASNFEGALGAGRFEATRYCINNFGTSDVDWELGPDDPPEALLSDRGRLIFRGTCLF